MLGHLLRRLIGCRLQSFAGQWCNDMAGGKVLSLHSLEFDNGVRVELRIEATTRGWKIVPRGVMPADHPQRNPDLDSLETYP